MRIELAAFLIPFLCCCIFASPPSTRIVAGSDASDGEFPYAVSIRYNNCHECGASIISDRWVLTAAHCIFLEYMNLSTILYGTIEADNCQEATSNTKRVKRAIIHEAYQNYSGHFNDIGLIEVEDPFEFSNEVKPVLLPKLFEHPPVFQPSYLVGWGYEETNGTVPPVLQKVSLDIYPDQICSMFFGSNYSQVSHICAGGGGKGQCSGDSGGALTVNGHQHGIVSWSDKPCTITPGVLTRVSSFVNWIKRHTGIL
ncbi:chymotrypsin-1-like [Cylas formicarius]|uniref:chymotrypsin-1-like n=1 Tax=Cylas formicarius TaxID=197179 RepID=UPI0029589619|nr:chymotrypsin-1-like [Cylas formicarius]